MSREDLALEVFQFISRCRVGTLCSLSQRFPGYPFGSLAPYALSERGHPILSLSRISEHYKNVRKDERVSLFVAEPGNGDPQARARVCALGKVVLAEDYQAASRYFERFPEAPAKQLAHDFEFLLLKVESLRWIGGFGDIHWVSAEEYYRAARGSVA